MEIAGLGIGLAGLYSACIEAVHRLESYRNFEVETRQISAHFNADKVILRKWADRVGIVHDGLAVTYDRRLDDPGVASAVRDVLLSLRAILEATHGARKNSYQENADRPLYSQKSNSLSKSAHAISTSSRKRDKLSWTFGGKEKLAALVDTFGKLVGKLDGLVPIHGSHRYGFEDPKQSNELVVKDTNQLVKRVLQHFKDQDRTEFISRIDCVQDDERYESCKACRTQGTSSWIFEKEPFVNWSSHCFSEDSAKFLWIHGPAGYGKSVLCAAIIEYLQQDDQFRPVHHFCVPTSQSQENIIAVLKSWLAQMVTMDDDLLELALEELRQSPHRVGKTSLWKLFTILIKRSNSWTFVVDGIDEYQLFDSSESWDIKEDRSRFLINLQKAVVGTPSRVLVVSRDEPDIRLRMSPTGIYDDSLMFYEHRISITDVSSDVLAFSRSVVENRLANKSNEIKTKLAEKMAVKCDGMFLWIDLHKRDLRGGKNERQLQRSIEEMPAGLESIYERNWNEIMRLASSDKFRALDILRWATFAARPLTVAELTEALLVPNDDNCGNLRVDDLPDCIDNEYVADEISGLCGSLLEVRSTGVPSPDLITIHLRHFSVRQFLLTKNAQLELSDEEHNMPSHSDTQNNHLAISCLRYLRYENVQEDLKNEAGKRSFVDYAVQSWYQHVSRTGKRYRELNQIAIDLFMPENVGWDLWRLRYDQLSSLNHPETEAEVEVKIPPPRIYYAAYFGLEEIVNHLHSNDPKSINASGGRYGTPMKAAYAADHVALAMRLTELGADLNISAGEHGSVLGFASYKGDLQTCKTLLAKGASLLLTDEQNRSPLYIAAKYGHVNTIKLLLDHGAELSTLNVNGFTPVNAACVEGHTDVIKLLFDHGADISSATVDKQTPLYSASINGHSEVVKLLLDYGADPSAVSIDDWTPINGASDQGHTATVKLLLEHGADLSTANAHGQAPLYTACLGGFVEIAKLLLDYGADSSRTYSGWTPLHAASDDGYTDIVRLLLEYGADLSIANDDGQTPLYTACLRGFVKVAKLLLDHGTNPSTASFDGWTPVNAASDNGHTELVKLLLEYDADVSVANKYGRTPLYQACAGGYTDIVALLLKSNADVSVRSDDGWTPILKASLNGHTEVVSLLLENDADPSVTEKKGYTPLNAASWNGHTNVVRLLLEHNADTKIPDAQGWTPLNVASWKGYTEIVRLLLERNADTKVPDTRGWAPLNTASWNGYIDIVRLLLKHNADPEDPDNDGITPLGSASRNGNTEIVRLLLEHNVDPENHDNKGLTPLISAALNDQIDVIRILLESGASPSVVDKTGRTALQAAAQKGHLRTVSLLLSNVSDLSPVTESLETGLHIASLPELSRRDHVKVTQRRRSGNALRTASGGGHGKVVKMLPRAEVNVNAQSASCPSALYEASFRGFEEVVQVLLKAGADPNAQGGEQGNPLKAASKGGHEKVVQILLRAGANPNA